MINKKNANYNYAYIALIFVFLVFVFSLIYLFKQRVFTYGDGRYLPKPTPTPNSVMHETMESEPEVSGSSDIQDKIKELDSLNVDEVTTDLYQNSVDASSF